MSVFFVELSTICGQQKYAYRLCKDKCEIIIGAKSVQTHLKIGANINRTHLKIGAANVGDVNAFLSNPFKRIKTKAKTGNTKSSKTVMSHPEHYGETRLIKFGDYNIGSENNIMTLPYYLAFVLGRD